MYAQDMRSLCPCHSVLHFNENNSPDTAIKFPKLISFTDL